MEDILAITFIFGGGSLFLLAISPVGRAIGDRIRGIGVPTDVLQKMRESHLTVLDELEQIRQELAEVQERLDFVERLLAKQRDRERLLGEGPQEPT